MEDFDYIPGTEIKKFAFSKEDLLDCLPKGFYFHRKPYYHQLLSVVFAMQFDNGVGLYLSMGTGKTQTAIDILRAKCIEDRILVISVGASLYNWKEEFKINAGNEYKVKVVSGSSKEKNQLLSERADVYIINYEGTFARKKLERDALGRKKRRRFVFEDMVLPNLNKSWNAIVLDESREIMSAQAYQTRIAMRLTMQSDFCIVMSGLPIVKFLGEIFTQQFCIDKGDQFSTSYNRFIATYFRKELERGFPKLVPYGFAEPEIHKKMYQQGIRYVISECWDLPPKIHVTRELEIKGDAKSFYQDLKRKKAAMVITKKNKVEVNAILIRFMQICGGWLKAGDEVMEFKNNVKLDELLYLLNGELASDKVVIIASFVAEQHGIYDFLEQQGITVLKIVSGMNPEEIFEAAKKFNEADKPIRLVMSPRVGGRAINLKACYMIKFSQDFDKEANLQAEDRIYGSGRGIEGVSSTYIRFIIKESVDEKVEQVLRDNARLIDKVIEGKKIGDYI